MLGGKSLAMNRSEPAPRLAHGSEQFNDVFVRLLIGKAGHTVPRNGYYGKRIGLLQILDTHFTSKQCAIDWYS